MLNACRDSTEACNASSSCSSLPQLGGTAILTTVRSLTPDKALRRFCFLLFCLASFRPALADPGYYLLTPYSLPGQLALDLRYWTVKSPGRQATLWPELGLRYGFSSRWTSEVFASYIGDSLREQNLSSLNWQNSYLLTQGQYPFDLAMHAQLMRNRGDGVRWSWGRCFRPNWGRPN